jgi:hypothetical protein
MFAGVQLISSFSGIAIPPPVMQILQTTWSVMVVLATFDDAMT